jgi:8-oxo-dGTP pyrophosphatase MutT (NUDIX family)
MIHIRQSGVIPYRVNGSEIEVLLITSSNGKRWIIPKGWVPFWLTSARSAKREAWEEAGVKGTVITPAIGSYTTTKFGQLHRVSVFLMRVDVEVKNYPEASYRNRQWMSIDQAIQRVQNKKLKQLFIQISSSTSWLQISK